MNYIEFTSEAVKAVRDYIGEGGEVRLTPMQKNNGIVLDGLVIKTGESRVSPTIYLESFFKMYKNGTPFAEVIGRLISNYEEHKAPAINMDFFTDYGQVKDRICFKLVNAGMNGTLLEEVPHRLWNDLAIVYIYLIEQADLSSATVLIKNDHIKMWNVAEEDLYEAAAENSRKLMHDTLYSMADIIGRMFEENQDITDGLGVHSVPELEIADRMFILSNRQKLYGASSILYTKHIEEMAKRNGDGIYILPSSIHELILIPRSEFSDEKYMKEMIREVNRTEVGAEEKLSDSLYFYDPETGEVNPVV